MTRLSFLVLCASSLLAPILTHFESHQDGPTIDVSIDQWAAQYAYLRSMASSEVTLPEAWKQPVAGLKEALKNVGDQRRILPLDGAVLTASSRVDLDQLIESLPEATASQSPTKPTLKAIRSAMASTEQLFRTEAWPELKPRLEAAQSELKASLAKHGKALLDFVLDGLQIKPTLKANRVLLVDDWPPVGATTLSTKHGAVCIVGIKRFHGSTLLEVVLHEATHAMESTANEGPPSVLDRLRQAMLDNGIHTTDSRFRDVPHTLMFVHTAEAVRRTAYPTHVDYGDASGYYNKVKSIADAIKPIWHDRLEGKISVDEAVAKIIEAVRDRS